MYQLNVFKHNSAHKATVTASHPEILRDHLKASAARYGFDVVNHSAGGSGDLFRNGKLVGFWEVSEL
ncbi:hypothetical protein SEA_SERENITY_93 [Mycobacterium phage Serenity]|uniref:hypothetical protein n=1 Tax=Mycobacterium phage Serenity TaxID=1701853 RepID=UPI0006CE329A|nr:hypothetical protein SEA_SERENITY_93 [Mycobacterium phage Serenity]ALF00960.1 hypothetical protein SEA_SERENITY_93 [Mycobacterium phage Serenity]